MTWLRTHCEPPDWLAQSLTEVHAREESRSRLDPPDARCFGCGEREELSA